MHISSLSKPVVLVTASLILTLGAGAFVAFGRQEQPGSGTPTPWIRITVAEQIARLEVFTEPVGVKLPGKSTFSPAKNAMEIPEGAEIKTGPAGRAQIVFPGGTVTRIDHDSVIKVETFEPEPQNIIIKILRGKIWSRIKKLIGSESYQSVGEGMIATVRGTSYGHGILGGGTNRGHVLAGTVQLECLDKTREATLGANMRREVNCAKNTGFAPEELQSVDMNDEWVRFNIEQDKQLDTRFGEETYDDYPTPTPSPSPTGTVQGTSTGNSTAITRTPQSGQSGSAPSATPVPASITMTSIPVAATATQTPVRAPSAPTAPTATSIPPKTVPNPPVLRGASYDPGLIGGLLNGVLQYATVTITGANMTGGTVSMTDAGSPSYREQTDSRIVAVFPNVKCGGHTVTVTTQGGSATTGVTIDPPLCLQLNILGR
jgi:hypothetical protein